MQTNNRRLINLKPIALAAGLGLAISGAAFAGQHEIKTQDNADAATIEQWKGEAYQGWLDGKVEMALMLNTNLNAFEINTKTAMNTVTLSGTVDSPVHAELAEQIALGVDGIESVNNELTVDQDVVVNESREEQKSFSQHWTDATTTAKIKSKLLLEDTVKGLDISVDTDHSVVTLNGTVESDAAKDLVESIAENTESVATVNNQLIVVADKS
ncbi:BON domain-containing protein [Arenicella xantha]|uniref:Osmotically-inducible protein OsmY n=1 Tax=Arenicella xantha TaxID=644221 RepID=A0A395JEZ4_9GAMM|nr:BON domain-containing protein [Arenicella xantha]RBP47112.1 osmotically-inducible protein OsmY [Arenicella xantha]